MPSVLEQYISSKHDFELIVRTATNLSIRTHGIEVQDWQPEYGTKLFAKLCVHSLSILKLIPSASNINSEIWDISSIACFTRTIIDTYYNFFYLTIDDINENEKQFRFYLWNYHSEKHRLKLVQLHNPDSPHINELRTTIETLEPSLFQNQYYQDLSQNKQRDIRRGKISIILSNTELSERADIDPKYYQTVFRYLSSYIHSHPYSLSQLSQFQAGSDDSLRLIKTIIDYATGYICHTVNDFNILMEDHIQMIRPEVSQLIDMWLHIHENIHND